jgi:hypothetical protein
VAVACAGLLFYRARCGALRGGFLFFGFHVTILGAQREVVNAGREKRKSEWAACEAGKRGG